jgi:site-specific DNA-methyltransferase (adenine-specific)
LSVYHGRFPNSIIKFNRERGLHPTQKPVKLFEYLIKTYTNEGDLVLDNCAGSGTTGVACEITNRNSILIEKEPEYCQIIRERLSDINLDQYQPQRTHIPLTDF